MLQMQCLDRVRQNQRTVDKPTFKGTVTDLIGSSLVTTNEPQAFLVEQTANWVLPVHFHREQQFQLFVGGSGLIGKSNLAPLTVHYASPHSGYGPLTSKEEGLAYLTLRPLSDTGAWYLPESRPELRTDIKKLQRHAAPETYVTDDELRQLRHIHEETLLQPDDTGLAAWLMRLPPNTNATPPVATANNEGRYYVVTKGQLHCENAVLPSLATLYAPTDKSPALTAGTDGAEVFILQFPYNSQFENAA